jgi:hypothetical protein
VPIGGGEYAPALLSSSSRVRENYFSLKSHFPNVGKSIFYQKVIFPTLGNLFFAKKSFSQRWEIYFLPKSHFPNRGKNVKYQKNPPALFSRGDAKKRKICNNGDGAVATCVKCKIFYSFAVSF